MDKKSSYYNLSERKFLLRVVDILLVTVCLFLATLFLNFSYLNFSKEPIFTWIFLLIFYYLIFGEVFQLYNLNVSNNRYLIVRSVVLTAFSTTIFYIFTPFISPELPTNRLQIVYFFLLISVPIILWRFLYTWLIFSPKFFKNIVFIGKSERIEKILNKIKNDNFHNVISYISDKEITGINGFQNISSAKLDSFIKKSYITEVIVSKAGFSKEIIDSLNKELILLFEKGVNIISYEGFYEDLTGRVPKEYLDHNFYKYINFSKNNENRFYLFWVRFIDIAISLFGLISFTVLIPLLLLGNLIGNRGPLFYTQIRVGENGKFFKIYKLRSMVKNAEINGAVWAKKNDARITSFGKFLRNTRLDEVPQFFNILKGEMSIIGPRPERPEFVKDLEDKIPFYAIRHVVRPGLTGWAQVNYPYASTLEEQRIKLRYDLYYIKERNSFLDFKILIKTITTILYYRGQ
ncbi:exopolysaccharide biosynthesis polyprenyl glycosylphosphotransferase [Polaribacter pectinis]|uniref:exopolysaccharide biosynthesis polyprenyl glycosylphosphotransferase n=1 Tax=Polaribacter pectinis TaxID=2738844 RepID=UPI0020C7C532|nr:exopolysaccharide biosynthesis polyprenyl glycosylphosphotransferase [Polaribacter pectinis]